MYDVIIYMPGFVCVYVHCACIKFCFFSWMSLKIAFCVAVFSSLAYGGNPHVLCIHAMVIDICLFHWETNRACIDAIGL